jgi:hypothetical protein
MHAQLGRGSVQHILRTLGLENNPRFFAEGKHSCKKGNTPLGSALFG